MSQINPTNQPQSPSSPPGSRQFVHKVGEYVWSFVLLTAYGLVTAFCLGAAYLGFRILILGVRMISHAIGLEG